MSIRTSSTFSPHAPPFKPLNPAGRARLRLEIAFATANCTVQDAEEKVAEMNRMLEVCERNLRQVREWIKSEDHLRHLHAAELNSAYAGKRFWIGMVQQKQKKFQEAYDKRSRTLDRLLKDPRTREDERRFVVPMGLREWEWRWLEPNFGQPVVEQTDVANGDIHND